MPSVPLAEEFATHLRRVFKRWSAPVHDVGWFRRLACYDEANLQQELANPDDLLRGLVVQALERLAVTEPEAAALLRQRYIAGASVLEVADTLNIVEGTVYKKQREGLRDLARICVQLETEARTRRRVRQTGRLEAPTYTQLFGVTSAIQTLSERLLAAGPPWIVAIEGFGGLGKTALADQLMRRMIETTAWSDVAWVTARQSYLNLGGGITRGERPPLTPESMVEALLWQTTGRAPYTAAAGLDRAVAQLQSRMQRFPYLVVVDNLESIADVEGIFDTLRRLVGPTKVILTTRHSPYSAGDVFHYRIPPLTPADALSLIKFEARQRNLPSVAAADDTQLQQIVELVGGNPLALRLIVGQLHVHPLRAVLADLAMVRSAPVENLYTYLYRQAWEELDENDRMVLLSMPLITEQGADLAYVAGLLGRDENSVRAALSRLVALNLVDSVGDINERHYTIHSLTRTFLHSHVLQWTEPE